MGERSTERMKGQREEREGATEGLGRDGVTEVGEGRHKGIWSARDRDSDRGERGQKGQGTDRRKWRELTGLKQHKGIMLRPAWVLMGPKIKVSAGHTPLWRL